MSIPSTTPWRGVSAALSVFTALLVSIALLVAPSAYAEEDLISAPAPLQWPVQAGATANSDFSITLLRQQIELGANAELCKMLLKDAHQPIPDNFNWSLCPAEFQAKVNARQGKVTWSPGAKPSECGTNCVGRPFMTQSTARDKPNSIFAMLYGHLDFDVDVPGPFNRSVRYGYEAHFSCVMTNGAHEGDFTVNVVFGTPVVSDPGILESIADFMIPAHISDAIDAGIRKQLATPGSQSNAGARCTSIGARQDQQPPFDSALFDQPSARRPPFHHPVGTALDKTATVHFLRITRKPPTFGYTPPTDAGQFSVFVNGAAGFVPATPTLNLPVAGGSAPLNLCKTVDMNGADRLQLIFVNSLGGAVWSQFAANNNFGAGPAHTMTTGRQVVVPGLPGPPDSVTGKTTVSKPQTLVLREFELLYTIDYHAPPTTVSSGATTGTGTGTGGTRTGTLTGVLSGRPTLVLDPGTPPPQPCQKI